MSGKCYRPEFQPSLNLCNQSTQTSAVEQGYTQTRGNAAVQAALRAQSAAGGNAPATGSKRTEPTVFSHGRRPTADNPGPHAYIENDGQSSSTGVGLYQDKNVQMMNGELTMGNNYGDNRERRSGVKASTQMFKGETNSDGWLNAEMSVFDANAQADFGQDGATLGGGANVLSGAVTVGNKNPSARNNMDTSARVGAGLGLGFGGRGHWGDKDNDGVPEVGFGADFGQFSVDLKSEGVGHCTNFVGDQLADAAGHPGGMQAYHTNSDSAKRDAARPPAALSWLSRKFGL